VTDIKLVRVILDQSLSWQNNTDYICQKAIQNLWIIRRLKKIKINFWTLLDVHCKEVRSVLEHAVPVWHSGLTRKQTVQIEKVQKTAFKIILDNTNYKTACTSLCVEPLEFRRIQLCIIFAKRDLKRGDTLFSRTGAQPKSRSKPKLVKEYRCRTSRCQKSSMPYLSSLLNRLSWSRNWTM